VHHVLTALCYSVAAVLAQWHSAAAVAAASKAAAAELEPDKPTSVQPDPESPIAGRELEAGGGGAGEGGSEWGARSKLVLRVAVLLHLAELPHLFFGRA
jgi:hypothetical protein